MPLPPNTNEPRLSEPTAVTLVRMEGKVDNIWEKVSDLRFEVTEHRGQITALQSDMRQVKSDATEAAKAVIEAEVARKNTADAVEEADKKRVADAKAIVDQSAQRWSPAMRYSVLVGTVVSALGLVLLFMQGVK